MRFLRLSSLPPILHGPIARGAAGTFLLRVINIGIVFGTTIVLTRTLGPVGYGAYSFTTTWLGILTIPATFGLDTFLVREVAAAQSRNNWSKFKGYMRSGHILTIVASIGILGVCLLLLHFGLIPIDPAIAAVLPAGLLAVPFLALSRIRSALLRGLGKVVPAQLPEMIILPLCVLFLIGGLYLFNPEELTSFRAISLYVAASVFALLVGLAILHRMTPKPAHHVPAEKISFRAMLGAAPFFWLAFISLINQHVDVTMLGILSDAHSVGLYQPAFRIASLVAMPQIMLGMAFGPRIASLYASDEITRIGELATKTARTSVLLGMPLALFAIIFAPWILGLFGTEYTQSADTLRILCAAKLIDTAFGFVGLLLSMTRHANAAFIGLAISVAVNITSNMFLIPAMGIEGAAISTAISVLTWNIILATLVTRKLGIDSTILGLFKNRKHINNNKL